MFKSRLLQLPKGSLSTDVISPDIMAILRQEQLFHIWVPKTYGGLGLHFDEGLQIIKHLAAIDGSLGWMITLCAGANYFSRNLKPHIAKELFSKAHTCLGGSGMIGGTAAITQNGYIINGYWKYATGAPHLSHFTINATITQDGEALLNEDGTEMVRSFVLHKDDVTVIADWQSMGMKATSTFSFCVENAFVHEDYSFLYNVFYTDNALDKIPFRIFADLTLLANYIGMAHHFCTEANKINPSLNMAYLDDNIKEFDHNMAQFAQQVTARITDNEDTQALQATIHDFGIMATQQLAHNIIRLYMQLGIIASHDHQPINKVFKDFFTATQHANFRLKMATP